MKKIIEEVRAMHPYMKSGNLESFYDYNKGWDDACSKIESRIEEIFQKKIDAIAFAMRAVYYLSKAPNDECARVHRALFEIVTAYNEEIEQ